MSEQVQRFFSSQAFAVAGASTNRAKYGNKVLRCYIQHNQTVYPINPQHDIIEGLKCLKDVNGLPQEVQSLSIVTPPDVTDKIVQEAIKKGIKNIWMQPGAESDEAISACLENQINIIAKGPCILAVSGYRE